MMSGLGHTSLSHAACIATAAATAPITPDVPLSPVPRYSIKFNNSRDQISSNQGMKC